MGADKTDEELMLAYAGGDLLAFEMLYRRHRGTLYRFLLRIEGGLGLDEIGEITGAGRETVKSRLRYALARIRTRFAT